MISIVCPSCSDTASVIRFGYNATGTARCRCKACGKTFTLNPTPTALSSEKQELIEKALAERISQRGIARTFKVSRLTIRQIRKKRQNALPMQDCRS
jgi:transposase-like protein